MAFVIDDDVDARESVCTLLKAMNVCCRNFPNASQFFDEPYNDAVGCVITDVRMPGISGLELVRRLHKYNAKLPAIVISAYIDVAGTVEAMKLGAITVLTKPFDDQELWEAIQTAFSRSIAMHDNAANADGIKERLKRLSDDEKTVANCLKQGMINKVIASKLGVSIRTIEDRRRRIMSKLEVDSLASFFKLYNDAEKLLADAKEI